MKPDKKTALIVEDSKALANMLSFLFMSRGIKVTTATNGAKAMEQIKESAPDIIITDLMMPEMDGFELCKAVKKDPELKRIPLIVVSALSTTNKEQLLSIGADDYFQKPFQPAELISAAERALVGRSH
ncbi:MAG: response regulator [bacterium]|nr:response regulator [bacterium]